jgi:hypothetical protein
MRLAFWGLFTIGLVACSAFGIGPMLKSVGGDWTSPWMLSGIALGAAIVALAVGFALGIRPARLATDQAMLIALAVLIGAKVAVSAVHIVVAR